MTHDSVLTPVYTSPAEPSKRLTDLPPYVFAQLDVLKAEARARGADLIDLGMGNPDLPTPEPILRAIQEGVMDPANHRYPQFNGKPEFREAVSRFMSRRYHVEIDPETEVQPLIGSKEGLAKLTFAYIGEGDYSIVFAPYYPVHARATYLAGGKVHYCAMTEENHYLPDVETIPEEVAQKAKLMFMNYPNNPSAATAPLSYLEKLVAYCKKHGIVLISDLAYGEICYDGYRPPSIFNVPDAKSVAIEYHSFSKSFNMAGWRMGWACGNPGVIKTLFNVKTNCDYGIASAIQDGGICALDRAEEFLPGIIQTYQERRDVVVKGFQEMGWTIEPPRSTLYVWLPVPSGFDDSKSWCRHLMDTTDVVITPGIAFGDAGDAYFRVSLVSSKELLQQAIDRLKAKGIRYS